ncbi:sulfurtransferase [Actinoalloteichus caeruleus]|uniref:sulfurtransferase n=1 Tax=Actinoalloteichus cyanogriseus TaxID=2893586 RepID=UPI0004AB962A|nr:sulfurtransferase [Actinoalloteichus caeruleus]
MGPLVTPDELAERLGAAGPTTLLDVRWSLTGPPGREAYDAGHLPGAVFVDLDTELAGPPGAGGRHPLPDAQRLGATLRAAGVGAGRPVVVYDAVDGSAAARAWWLLRWAGHPEVAVLDGGYAAWVGAGHPVTTEVPAARPGDFEVVPGSMPVLGATEAGALAGTGLLLDARAPERYRGEVEPVDPRPGHVPGAVNAPFGAHVTEEGRWRSREELAAHFAGLGVRPGQEVGVYCGSGVTACSVVLALEAAGVREAGAPAALYPGSWSEWSFDPARPAVLGPDPR